MSTLPSPSPEAIVTADYDKDAPVDQVSAASNEAQGNPDVVVEALKPPTDAEEARTATPVDVPYPAVEVGTSAPQSGASTEPQSKPPVKRRAPAKKARVDAVAQSTGVAHKVPLAQSSSSRDPFFDEVASLDEDIKTLRRQLAQKLQLQNAQLRKMLERFGAS
ncbi:hypothetical protein QA648_31515 (plasmid) [Rhizobium sp. CB3171]|uniref:hypothetical protein n=2 Tax=unclassified Rhizobium TaxID=2613769 RepID=UPI0024B03CFF|nr:hypothetical protein [Rhizobium sp. CB3171]WFU05251.1 hypothetical protein QA648_31515 [Rhizobium sp. CB3171]